MTKPIARMTTPILLLVFAYSMTLSVTTAVHVDGRVWTPCGIRGGTMLPRARERVSMTHCFVNRSTILAFNDVMSDEYQMELHATINSVIPTEEIYPRRNESSVTFLCRGLILMDSFIHELDYADGSSFRFDVATLKHRFVLARDSLNASLTTMITKCPLLTEAPLQVEEVDTNATVSLLTERSSDSNWMRFIYRVKTELKTFRVGRYSGSNKAAIYPNCQGEIICAKGTILEYDHAPLTGEEDWE